MTKHLVCGDPHAEPKVSNERFDLLGKFILDQRPDVIVCIGDFGDMPSLSSYDRGKKSFEGRRYRDDINAANDALARINAPVDAYNLQQAANHKVQYRPRKVMLGGNHDEARIRRATEASPELDGTISLTDIRYREHGWEYVPYLQPIEIDGIYYNHFFVSGVKGEAIGGVNPAKAIIMKQMVSCTSGHTHLLDFATASSPNGKHINGLVCGCFFEQPMAYAHATEYLWNRGLALKHNVHDGEYDFEWWSMERLKKEYPLNA